MAETAAAEAKPQTLDDLMIAMDVVDTLRHREDLVQRELDEEGREAELIARLKQIYHDQGIEVPDHVLADGVKALKESRFVYTPPPASWKRTLLTAWVKRDTYAKRLGALVLLLAAVAWGYYFVAVRPAQLLPKALQQAHAGVLAIPTDAAAKEKANTLLADGEREARAGNRAAATKKKGELLALRDELTREYKLTIVSRPGEPTAVWRVPPRKLGSQAKNYYLIVEAITPDGRKLSLPLRNEETGETETVAKFGVRVPQSVFEAVAQDKKNDGIVQNNIFGVRPRGSLAVEYKMPFEGGYITKW